MTSHPDAVEAALAPDPVFVLGTEGHLDLPAGADPLAAWRLCTVRVVHDRLDLDAHVRRVLLTAEPALADRADGALLDLADAAGRPGAMLTRTMLAQAGHRIAPALRLALTAWLEQDDAPLPGWPPGPGRALGTDIAGATTLVARERLEQAEETPLRQAMALIDEGQLDPARELLEATLLAQPDDGEVQRELLGLYHHLRDDALPAAMGRRLLERYGRLPAGWPDEAASS